jgi:hypothetical protein
MNKPFPGTFLERRRTFPTVGTFPRSPLLRGTRNGERLRHALIWLDRKRRHGRVVSACRVTELAAPHHSQRRDLGRCGGRLVLRRAAGSLHSSLHDGPRRAACSERAT